MAAAPVATANPNVLVRNRLPILKPRSPGATGERPGLQRALARTVVAFPSPGRLGGQPFKVVVSHLHPSSFGLGSRRWFRDMRAPADERGGSSSARSRPECPGPRRSARSRSRPRPTAAAHRGRRPGCPPAPRRDADRGAAAPGRPDRRRSGTGCSGRPTARACAPRSSPCGSGRGGGWSRSRTATGGHCCSASRSVSTIEGDAENLRRDVLAGRACAVLAVPVEAVPMSREQLREGIRIACGRADQFGIARNRRLSGPPRVSAGRARVRTCG